MIAQLRRLNSNSLSVTGNTKHILIQKENEELIIDVPSKKVIQGMYTDDQCESSLYEYTSLNEIRQKVFDFTRNQYGR